MQNYLREVRSCHVIFLPTFGILGLLPVSGTVIARNFIDIHKSVQIE